MRHRGHSLGRSIVGAILITAVMAQVIAPRSYDPSPGEGPVCLLSH
jgi:hypothetical protein